VVESTSGGFKFPDGTTQTTKATSSNGTVTSIATGTGLTGGTITTSGTISLVTTAGAVGTYGFLLEASGASLGPGATKAGSDLYWSAVAGTGGTGISTSGTWQLMGESFHTCCSFGPPISLWIRIA